MKAVLWTDGGVRTGGVKGPTQGRSGRAAIGYVLRHPDLTMIDKGGMIIGDATVNEAEYSAVIRGLFIASTMGVTSIHVKSDSQLIVNQMNGTWACKQENLKEYREEALKEAAKFDEFEIEWVPREQNQHADMITREFLD